MWLTGTGFFLLSFVEGTSRQELTSGEYVHGPLTAAGKRFSWFLMSPVNEKNDEHVCSRVTVVFHLRLRRRSFTTIDSVLFCVDKMRDTRVTSRFKARGKTYWRVNRTR